MGTAEPTEDRVDLVDARGPGFGLPSAGGAEAARLAARTEGLLLDATYTAKAFAVLVDLITSGASGTTVFLHTGGLWGANYVRSSIHEREQIHA
jgi:D-cysteine desulfhydrase